MTSWLQRQRKGDLQNLAENAGIKDTDGMLKDELVGVLETTLKNDAAKLSSNPVFSEYYDRRGSPIKKSSEDAAEPSAKEKRVRRRTTKVKEELESPDDSTPNKALATRTPRAVQRVASRVPLPPSPAVVTDAIDRQTTVIRARVGKWYKNSGTVENVEYLREFLSSVVGVELVSLLVEYNGLQSKTLPLRYAFDIPATGLTSSHAVKLPDFFKLLTHDFWGPTTVWASTSIFLPLLAAYFFNFTLKAKTPASRKPTSSRVDPLTFNVAKALVSWLVYTQGMRFGGLIADQTVADVNGALWGGVNCVLIGSAIGTLSSLYDAVLKK